MSILKTISATRNVWPSSALANGSIFISIGTEQPRCGSSNPSGMMAGCLSHVAIQNEELAGMVSLIFDDLPGYEHLNPWLASLLVLPEYRKRGIGARLVREAEQCLLLNGIPRAYLFTESAGAFFEKLGWILVESGTCNHYPIVILKKEFPSNNSAA